MFCTRLAKCEKWQEKNVKKFKKMWTNFEKKMWKIFEKTLKITVKNE